MSLPKKSLIPSASKKIYYLFIGFVLVIPLFFDVRTSGLYFSRNIFGEKPPGILFTVPVSVFIIVILAVQAFLGGVTKKNVVFKLEKKYSLLLGPYVFWITIIALYSATFHGSLESLLYLSQLLLPLSMFIFFSQIVQRPEVLIYLIKGMFYGLIGTLLFNLSYIFIEVGFPNALFERLMMTKAWEINIYQAFSYYPLGLTVVFLLWFGIFSNIQKRHVEFVKILGFLALLGGMIILLLCLAARGPIVALLFGLFSSTIVSKKTIKGSIGMFALPLIIVAGLVLMITVESIKIGDKLPTFLLRFANQLKPGYHTGGRLRFAAESFQFIFRNPIIGTALTLPDPHLRSAHNYYIDTLMWTGMPGLLLIGSILIISLKDALSLAQKLRPSLWKGVAIGAFSVLMTIIFISNNARVPMRQPYSGMLIWAIIGIVAGMKTTYSKQWIAPQKYTRGLG